MGASAGMRGNRGRAVVAIAARAIALRLARARAGNLGDTKAVGGGVSEMRIHVGKGYRIYYCCRGRTLILLLCGGDKSTQADDIERAKQLAADGLDRYPDQQRP